MSETSDGGYVRAIQPILRDFEGARVKRERIEDPDSLVSDEEWRARTMEMAERLKAKYGVSGACNRLEISQTHFYNFCSGKRRCSRAMYHKMKTLDEGGEASIIAIEILSRQDIAALNIVGQALMDAGKHGALKALLKVMNRHDVAVAFEENEDDYEDITLSPEQLKEQRELYMKHVKEHKERRAAIEARWAARQEKRKAKS